MAYDKIVDSVQLDTNLTAIANAIREKNGTSAQIPFPDGFVAAIQVGANLAKIAVYVADLTDKTSYTIIKGTVDGYKRKITI